MAPRKGDVSIQTPNQRQQQPQQSQSVSLSSHGSQPTASILRNPLRTLDSNASVNFVGKDGRKFYNDGSESHNSSRSHSNIGTTREEDVAAVQRAELALGSACVLRKTGFAAKAAAKPAQASNAAAKRDSRSRSLVSNPKENTGPAMNLPRTIPVTISKSNGNSSFNTSLSSKRSRSSGFDVFRTLMGDRLDAPAPPLARRRLDQTVFSENETTAVSARATPKVSALTNNSCCTAMFKGVSAIPLSDKLFDSPEEESEQCRICFQPLWSLVGTHKIALHTVVEIDYNSGALKWNQQNPRGGYQRISIPLSAIEDASCTRILQKDAGVKETQYSAVVRTSTRPSQVVFGFRTQSNAKKFCISVKK